MTDEQSLIDDSYSTRRDADDVADVCDCCDSERRMRRMAEREEI